MLNNELASYAFLGDMTQDSYYPRALVEKGQRILSGLCEKIETQRPASLEQLYALTHAATGKFNALAEEFDEQGSEIETVARECIARDFYHIAKTYGFENADIEELISPRDW